MLEDLWTATSVTTEHERIIGAIVEQMQKLPYDHSVGQQKIQSYCDIISYLGHNGRTPVHNYV